MPKFILPPPPLDTSHIQRKWLDIPYANLSPAQKLDIYLPNDGEGPFPVILAIHGGAFREGDKGTMQVATMLEGIHHGYAVVSINYRLSGEAVFPALLQDAKAAVRWVRAHAAEYQLNPEKIAAWGESAGGWQASMLGVTGGVQELEDLSLGNPEQSSRVQAAVVFYGPTNFLMMDELLEEGGAPFPPGALPFQEPPFFPGKPSFPGPASVLGDLPFPDLSAPTEPHSDPSSPESLLVGAPIAQVPERVAAANPETYITPSACPFLLMHGVHDGLVPMLGSVYFAELLEKAIGKDRVTLRLLPNAGHADLAFGSPDNLRRVFQFLDRFMK